MDGQLQVSFLNCIFCKKSWKDSKVLPCLHSTCNGCFSTLLSYGSNFRCPVCQEDNKKTVVSNLPDNMMINILRESFGTDIDCRASRLCHLCGDSTFNCLQCRSCEMSFCHQCLPLHETMKSEKGCDENKSRPSGDKNRCDEHPEEMLRYLCVTCEEAICSECLIIKHRHHQLTKIEEYGNIYRTKLALLEKKIGLWIDPISEGIKRNNRFMESITCNADNAKNNVVNYIDKCKEILETVQKEMLDEIKVEERRKSLALQEQTEELSHMFEKLRVAQQFTRGTVQHTDDVEVALVRKYIMHRANYLEKINVSIEPASDDTVMLTDGVKERVKDAFSVEFSDENNNCL